MTPRATGNLSNGSSVGPARSRRRSSPSARPGRRRAGSVGQEGRSDYLLGLAKAVGRKNHPEDYNFHKCMFPVSSSTAVGGETIEGVRQHYLKEETLAKLIGKSKKHDGKKSPEVSDVRKKGRPTVLINCIGIFGQEIESVPCDQMPAYQFKDGQNPLEGLTSKEYSLNAGGFVDRPLSEQVAVFSVDKEDDKEKDITVITLKAGHDTLETYLPESAIAAILLERINQTLKALKLEDHDVVITGYSRGTLTALQLDHVISHYRDNEKLPNDEIKNALKDSPLLAEKFKDLKMPVPGEWCKRYRGAVTVAGVTNGTELADQVMKEGTKDQRMFAILQDAHDRLLPILKSKPEHPSIFNRLSATFKCIKIWWQIGRKFVALDKEMKASEKSDEGSKKSLGRLPEIGQMIKMVSDVIHRQFHLHRAIIDVYGNLSSFLLLFESLKLAVASMTTEARQQSLSDHPLSPDNDYVSIAAVMGDERTLACDELFKKRVGVDTLDFKFVLKDGYKTLTELTRQYLNDCQVSLANAVLHRTIVGKDKDIKIASMAIFGTHWAFLSEVLKDKKHAHKAHTADIFEALALYYMKTGHDKRRI